MKVTLTLCLASKVLSKNYCPKRTKTAKDTRLAFLITKVMHVVIHFPDLSSADNMQFDMLPCNYVGDVTLKSAAQLTCNMDTIALSNLRL